MPVRVRIEAPPHLPRTPRWTEGLGIADATAEISKFPTLPDPVTQLLPTSDERLVSDFGCFLPRLWVAGGYEQPNLRSRFQAGARVHLAEVSEGARKHYGVSEE